MSPDQPNALPVIGGYETTSMLSRGGMGVIYKAIHRKTNRVFALKVLRPDRVTNPEAVKRFMRELQASGTLTHPNTITSYAAGQCENTYYIAMEFVDGIDLGRLVAEKGPLPLHWACDFIRQAALGLQHLHERGLVHRDVKPGNLMVTPTPANFEDHRDFLVKILDMGLARLTEPSEPAADLTRDGGVLGTPDYIAPEQIDDPRRADIRSDLYSLGCTFYHLLAGSAPFAAGNMIQKLDCHRWSEPAAIQNVPGEIAALVRRLMAKRPENRFQVPGELAEALQQFGKRRAKDVVTEPRRADARWPMLGHHDWVTGVAFTPDSRLIVSASLDRTIRIWDVASGSEIGRLEGHRGGILGLALSSDGRHILTGGRDHTVRLWDLAACKEIHCWQGHTGDVECVALSADGRRALSGGQDMTVRQWGLKTGKPLREIGGTVAERHWDAILSVVCSPDGRRALTSSLDQTMRLWDLETGHEIRCFRGHAAAVQCVAFVTEQTLLSAADRIIRVWDGETGQVVRQLEGHEQPILGLAVSPDARLAASGSEDRTISLWELATGRQLRSFTEPRNWVLSVAFSADGKSLVWGSADGKVGVWQLDG